MLPSRHQYYKWSLPSKWSFWAAIVGIPIGIVSLILTLWPLVASDPVIAERQRSLLKAAQELRHNHEWLTELSHSIRSRSEQVPTGALKVDGLLQLIETHHDWLLRAAYGEEKYMHQHALMLRDLSLRLGSPESKSALATTLRKLDYTLDDIHFLNNFLFWYIKPHVVENLSSTQLYSLGWNGLPTDHFEVSTGVQPDMRRFVHDGKPIVEYVTYLGLID